MFRGKSHTTKIQFNLRCFEHMSFHTSGSRLARLLLTMPGALAHVMGRKAHFALKCSPCLAVLTCKCQDSWDVLAPFATESVPSPCPVENRMKSKRYNVPENIANPCKYVDFFGLDDKQMKTGINKIIRKNTSEIV